MRSHKARKVACDAVTPYVCGCGKSYANRHNLHRHRQTCASRATILVDPVSGNDQKNETHLGASGKKSSDVPVSSRPVVVQNFTHTVQNIQVTTLGHHQQITVSPTNQVGGPTTVASSGAGSTNIGAVEITRPTPTRLPGWPDKWPAPAILPSTFSPLGFEVSQSELESAVAALTAPERESCARGDTLGVSRLLVEVLKQVHAHPSERNVYLNPRRADQALVFIPSRWSAWPLEEATQVMFGRIQEVLRCASKASERDVASAVEGAHRGCEGRLPQLARASRSQMSAHLENVRQATATGEDWLGTGGDSEVQPAYIGKEFPDHLKSSMLAAALEAASGVYAESDVQEETAVDQTSRALAECARYLLHARPKNLTVLPHGVPDLVYVHERDLGWIEWPRAAAAEAILRRAAAVLDDQLYEAKASPLTAMRPWLRSRLREVLTSAAGREAAERVIAHWLASATRYYGSLPRTTNPHDRKEAARRILAGEGPCPPRPEPEDPTPALEYIPGSPSNRELSEAELADILGFAI